MAEMEIQNLLKSKIITNITIERVLVAKQYIEKKYKMKRQKYDEYNKEYEKFLKKVNELKISQEEKSKLIQRISSRETENMRLKRKKRNCEDFETIAIIGRGAFGEVRVCNDKINNNVVAMKIMKKELIHKKNQIIHCRIEREILTSTKSPWLVDLKYSFQDEFNLYFVMEFIQGGDFMTYLISKDILSIEEAKFYIAEIILAVEFMHSLNFIHRDLKPDNIMIDKSGHLKLADFGLSKISDDKFYPMTDEIEKKNINNDPKKPKKVIRKKRKIKTFSTVGTPDYIAPEVLSKGGYGSEIDFWSIGIIFYEMIIGYPPFYSDNAKETCEKIHNWRKNFTIPSKAKIPIDAENLIRLLISPQETRTHLTFSQIKEHAFFKGFDWNNIRKMTPPFIPELTDEKDLKYFEILADKSEEEYKKENFSKRKDICFTNFSYNYEVENLKSGLIEANEILETIKLSTLKTNDVHQVISYKTKEINISDLEKLDTNRILITSKDFQRSNSQKQTFKENNLTDDSKIKKINFKKINISTNKNGSSSNRCSQSPNKDINDSEIKYYIKKFNYAPIKIKVDLSSPKMNIVKSKKIINKEIEKHFIDLSNIKVNSCSPKFKNSNMTKIELKDKNCTRIKSSENKVKNLQPSPSTRNLKEIFSYRCNTDKSMKKPNGQN